MPNTDKLSIEASDAAHRIELPTFGIVMKVGPHSGMTLSEIAESKFNEETRGGVHYWGYSGTLCYPTRVSEFIEYALTFQSTPPQLLLIETNAQYSSPIGYIGRYSKDNIHFKTFPHPVQLQGAQYAFVCKSLRQVNMSFCLNSYSIVGGKKDGVTLDSYLRHRVNKACVKLRHVSSGSSNTKLAYIAQLVDPYVIWLKA
jgi:hypothetical protein